MKTWWIIRGFLWEHYLHKFNDRVGSSVLGHRHENGRRAWENKSIFAHAVRWFLSQRLMQTMKAAVSLALMIDSFAQWGTGQDVRGQEPDTWAPMPPLCTRKWEKLNFSQCLLLWYPSKTNKTHLSRTRIELPVFFGFGELQTKRGDKKKNNSARHFWIKAKAKEGHFWFWRMYLEWQTTDYIKVNDRKWRQQSDSNRSKV